MSVVLITGCSSGIGKESALAFAHNGDTVYASMRDASRSASLRTAADAAGLDIRVLALDVTKPTTFDSAVSAIVKESGRLDILVNNAGMYWPGAFKTSGKQPFAR